LTAKDVECQTRRELPEEVKSEATKAGVSRTSLGDGIIEE
jgi:hypothetical protein